MRTWTILVLKVCVPWCEISQVKPTIMITITNATLSIIHVATAYGHTYIHLIQF